MIEKLYRYRCDYCGLVKVITEHEQRPDWITLGYESVFALLCPICWPLYKKMRSPEAKKESVSLKKFLSTRRLL